MNIFNKLTKSQRSLAGFTFILVLAGIVASVGYAGEKKNTTTFQESKCLVEKSYTETVRCRKSSTCYKPIWEVGISVVF